MVTSCTSSSSSLLLATRVSSSLSAGSMNAPAGRDGGALQLTGAPCTLNDLFSACPIAATRGFRIKQWRVFILLTRVKSECRPCSPAVPSRPSVTERLRTLCLDLKSWGTMSVAAVSASSSWRFFSSTGAFPLSLCFSDKSHGECFTASPSTSAMAFVVFWQRQPNFTLL